VPQAEEPRAVEAARAGTGRCDYYGFQHVELVNGHGDRCFGPEYTAWLSERVPDFAERRDKREALCSVPSCYRWPLPPEVHSSRYIADRASAYLRDAAGHDAPFFLHCSFPDPHHPFTVPEPYDTLFAPEDMEEPSMPITESTNPPHAGVECYRNTDGSGDRIIGTPPCDYERFTAQDWKIVRAVTAGMNKQLDDCIGGLLAVLDQTGLAGNTIVVFASDHGDYLGDYGLLGKGLHYDCVLRTPLLMSGPGIPVSHRVDAMASLVDVAPTLLECAGLKEPEGMQGHSMLPGMTDESKWLRDAAMTENDDDMAGLRMRTLTTREWKLTTYAGDAFGELYNRLEDPGERNNLWNDASCSDVQQQLTARLLDHMLCAVDGSNGRVQKPVPGVVKHRPTLMVS
jgi:arylsulfatase A-like enzyme